MASPYLLDNSALQVVNCAGQSFRIYLAFLNPVAVTTKWNDLNMDAQGNWLPPPNFDCAANHVQPYAPTANLGPNRIGFVGEPLYFDGSRSSQRMDVHVNTGGFAWTIGGSPSIVQYAGGSQVAVTWRSPGLYTVSLQVTDRAGTTAVGTRQVMIYANRQNALPGVITVSGLSGSISGGGWQLQITTVNSQVTLLNPDSLNVGQYQPLVLMAETSYEVQPGVWSQQTLGPYGHFNPGYPYIDPRILFDGYIQNGTVHQDADKDTLAFSCSGPQMILQEAKTHQLGYYNCDYTGFTAAGVPISCKTSPAGQGFQVGGLTTMDVAHSLLQHHCNLGNYHDIHIWNPTIPTNPYTSGGLNAYYFQVFTTLSTNEGTIWQNLQDLCTNDFSNVYCERDGSIRIGPQINYRGQDYWAQPSLLGGTAAPYLLNLVQDLGYTVNGSPSQIANNMPTVAAQPMPLTFVHPWGHNLNPSPFLKPFSNTPNPQVLSTQQALLGPPILCTFSDVPIYDSAATPPDVTVLYPWVSSNWPQDLAVYPISIDIQENYTGRASLVKLIGTLYGHTSLWSSWYPQNTFQVAGDGTTSIVTSVLPASDWVLNESYVLPDVTSSQNAQLVWKYWWEMARRSYYARNINYNASVTVGMFTPVMLGDIVALTRQNTNLNPKFSGKPFSVTQIDHSLDLTARTWQTTITLQEVTTQTIGYIVQPPILNPPKG